MKFTYPKYHFNLHKEKHTFIYVLWIFFGGIFLIDMVLIIRLLISN